MTEASIIYNGNAQYCRQTLQRTTDFNMVSFKNLTPRVCMSGKQCQCREWSVHQLISVH